MLDYGIIGNCKTCALVKKDTSIDWLCFPNFNSPSIFAKILDEKKGGSFQIIPKYEHEITQKYIKDTNILETTFTSKNTIFKVYDFFPRYQKLLPNRKRKSFRKNKLIRIIVPVKGKPFIKLRFDPKFNYAKCVPELKNSVKNKIIIRNKTKKMYGFSNIDADYVLHDTYFKLDTKKYFVLCDTNDTKYSVLKCQSLMSATKKYWERWVGSLILPQKNMDDIVRSALTLKLLTFSETGAIIAAATTSIPEEIGSNRTWDYRFCWVRDASFTVDALKKIGRDNEPKRLMEFIFSHTVDKKKQMQIMYGINGEKQLTEKKLGHLEGFEGSKPVRVGNAAYNQKQNDVYGSLIDIIYLYYVYYEYESKMPVKFWGFLGYLIEEIEKNWKKKDKGIWEFRGVKHHFTYSKLMCYIGVDRAVKVAEHFNRPRLAAKWKGFADRIKNDILEKAWNEKKKAFTIYYGSEDLDAAVLLMCYHSFLPADDPKLVSTVNQIYLELRDGVSVSRYKMKDDFGKSTSTFTICAFWLVDALYYIGEYEKANEIFMKLKGYSNHLGLFSEDLDENNELMGNFPQAYTHIALINTSILLSEWSAHRIKLENGKRNKVK